jgi:pyridoxamine-phosphate oxidase
MDLYQLIDASQEPILRTHDWIQEAKDKEAGLPHALNLSSVSLEGQPSSRMVLLKRLSDEGLVFFTDYDGKKGQEIVNNNKAALNFWWAKTNKQIRIEGICKKVSDKESDDYFHSRPRGSQISALASKQTETLESYEGLLEKAKQIESDNEGKDIKRPDRWGGFVLKPNLFEFWTNQENRLHKRELFTLNEEGWEKSLLSP